MSRNWLMLLGLCQSHAAGIAAESTKVARGLEDDASNDASIAYRNFGGESESGSDNQCPTVVQRALPFPLPNPALVSDTFDHYLHCKQVVLNTVDPNSQDKAGAVITIEEHYNHCSAIVDSIVPPSAPILIDPSVCSALGLTGNSDYRGDPCLWSMIITEGTATLAPERAIIPDGGRRLMDEELVRCRVSQTYSVAMPVMSIGDDTVEVPTVEETPQANRLHGRAEMTSLPEDCKLSPEYYQMAMGWNHENLVVKSFRQPDRLTEAERAYLDSWVDDENVLAQYRIAEACSSSVLLDVGRRVI